MEDLGLAWGQREGRGRNPFGPDRVVRDRAHLAVQSEPGLQS